MGGKEGKKARRSAASGALPATGATPTNSGGGACGDGNPEGPNKKKAKKYNFSKYKNNTGDAVRTLMANAPTSNIPVQCTIFGGILCVKRINPNRTGWYKGLDTAVEVRSAVWTAGPAVTQCCLHCRS
jgi:hypothetical protein